MALQATDRIVLWLAPPLVVFARLTRPLILLMSGTANVVLRLFGYQPSQGEETVHSVEELLLLIEDTEEAGVLDADRPTTWRTSSACRARRCATAWSRATRWRPWS